MFFKLIFNLIFFLSFFVQSFAIEKVGNLEFLQQLAAENFKFYQEVIEPAIRYENLKGTPFSVGHAILTSPIINPEFKDKIPCVILGRTDWFMRIAFIKAIYELGVPVYLYQHPGLGKSLLRDQRQGITENSLFYSEEGGLYRVLPGEIGLFGLMDRGVEFYLRTFILPEIEKGKKFLFITESAGGASFFRNLSLNTDIRDILAEKSTVIAFNTTFDLTPFGKFTSDVPKALRLLTKMVIPKTWLTTKNRQELSSIVKDMWISKFDFIYYLKARLQLNLINIINAKKLNKGYIFLDLVLRRNILASIYNHEYIDALIRDLKIYTENITQQDILEMKVLFEDLVNRLQDLSEDLNQSNGIRFPPIDFFIGEKDPIVDNKKLRQIAEILKLFTTVRVTSFPNAAHSIPSGGPGDFLPAIEAIRNALFGELSQH